jgi:hypothetical protein
VNGREIEQEQQFALRFETLTAMWTLVGNAKEVRRQREHQEILDLLSEQLAGGMRARLVADALDKNYHPTRCLLRMMKATGEISRVNNHYLAIANKKTFVITVITVISVINRDL